jgi:hypothetical protein
MANEQQYQQASDLLDDIDRKIEESKSQKLNDAKSIKDFTEFLDETAKISSILK